MVRLHPSDKGASKFEFDIFSFAAAYESRFSSQGYVHVRHNDLTYSVSKNLTVRLYVKLRYCRNILQYEEFHRKLTPLTDALTCFLRGKKDVILTYDLENIHGTFTLSHDCIDEISAFTEFFRDIPEVILAPEELDGQIFLLFKSDGHVRIVRRNGTIICKTGQGYLAVVRTLLAFKRFLKEWIVLRDIYENVV